MPLCRRRNAVPLLVVAWAAFSPAGAQEGVVSISGTLTGEGVECPALRGDNGTLYTLTARSAVATFHPGDRLRITGRITPLSRCQQGTTIVPDKVEPER